MIANKPDSFTLAYVETALWSSMDESTEQGGEPMDANYSIDDIHPDTLAEMIGDCEDFRSSFGGLIPPDREEDAARDLWLTRNGHGAGFWDGDWDDIPYHGDDEMIVPTYRTLGQFLTAMSKPYGEFYLYVGDDGMIHGQ